MTKSYTSLGHSNNLKSTPILLSICPPSGWGLTEEDEDGTFNDFPSKLQKVEVGLHQYWSSDQGLIIYLALSLTDVTLAVEDAYSKIVPAFADVQGDV